MKNPSFRFFLAAIVLYFAVGIVYQVWTCATWETNLGLDGLPPDTPCAGIPWTVFIVGLWPAYGALEVFHGHPVAGTLFDGAFLALIALFVVGVRREGREQNNQSPVSAHPTNAP